MAHFKNQPSKNAKVQNYKYSESWAPALVPAEQFFLP